MQNPARGKNNKDCLISLCETSRLRILLEMVKWLTAVKNLLTKSFMKYGVISQVRFPLSQS